MDLHNIFRAEYLRQNAHDCDLCLTEYKRGYYTGVDKNGRAVVVVDSSTPNANTFVQQSNSLIMKCNVKVRCSVCKKVSKKTVHSLICNLGDQEKIFLFLDFADMLLRNSSKTPESIVSVYNALSEFFSNNKNWSDNELLGLYGELLTIVDLDQFLNLASAWQSRDRMNFDFYVSDNTKIEVKTTLKPQRVHRFKHNQLTPRNFDVYVISYRMRFSDQGTSLYELIEKSKDLCLNDTKKILFLSGVIKDVGVDRLKEFCLDQDFAKQERRFYINTDIPHFRETTPKGVYSVEYDVDLSNSPAIPQKNFIEALISPSQNIVAYKNHNPSHNDR